MNTLLTVDLGLIAYEDAYALQERVVTARKAGAIPDVLLICEHPHVITFGRNAKRENLLAEESLLRQKGVQVQESNRGGDITYHGPGQIVGYPILDLSAIRRDVHWYVRTLEEIMIRATSEFGWKAFRVPGRTGIWVQPTASNADGKHVPEEKLAAIGVHISRWVTSHGFAYNVCTDLQYFDLIVPCGIQERKATSLEKLLGVAVNIADAKAALVREFAGLFSFELCEAAAASLEEKLPALESTRR